MFYRRSNQCFSHLGFRRWNTCCEVCCGCAVIHLGSFNLASGGKEHLQEYMTGRDYVDAKLTEHGVHEAEAVQKQAGSLQKAQVVS